MKAAMLGVLSLGCLYFWGYSTADYLSAGVIMLVGAASGGYGLWRALRSFQSAATTMQRAAAIPVIGLTALGLIANLGLYAVAILDL
jgi:hypothetical protein